MKNRFNSHFFWGSHSPFSALTGVGLIVLASSKFAFALISTGALLWVYGLTALVFSSARPILPARGRMIILLFLSAFFCGVFMLLASLINPLLILGTGFFLILIPLYCLGSGFFDASETLKPTDLLYRGVIEAAMLGGIILAIALIREPLGTGTLSFPGGSQGILELFSSPDAETLPARLLSSSAGGLLLLGYGIALFRYVKERNGISEESR